MGPLLKARPLIVFCDFDGTITQRDVVLSVAEAFCPPVWRQIVDDIRSRTITVRQGMVEIFKLIPSSQKEEILRFTASTVKIREGFEPFLQFCRDNGMLFVVCSGGADFLIEPVVAPYRSLIKAVFATETDFSTPMISLRQTMACEMESACKVKAMEQFPGAIRILIGDSVTDLHAARNADLIFARDGLPRYLDEEKIPYHRFETFLDVIQGLKQFRGPSEAQAEACGLA